LSFATLRPFSCLAPQTLHLNGPTDGAVHNRATPLCSLEAESPALPRLFVLETLNTDAKVCDPHPQRTRAYKLILHSQSSLLPNGHYTLQQRSLVFPHPIREQRHVLRRLRQRHACSLSDCGRVRMGDRRQPRPHGPPRCHPYGPDRPRLHPCVGGGDLPGGLPHAASFRPRHGDEAPCHQGCEVEESQRKSQGYRSW
jgi:hypothetical protein